MEEIPEELYPTNEYIDIGIKEINNEPPRHKKQILTKNLIITSIDNAATLGNYDLMELPNQEKKTSGVIKDAKDTRTIKFVNKPSIDRIIGRRRNRNVISAKFCVTEAVRNAETELQHLKLFLTNEILKGVLHHHNTKIIKTINKLPKIHGSP